MFIGAPYTNWRDRKRAKETINIGLKICPKRDKILVLHDVKINNKIVANKEK